MSIQDNLIIHPTVLNLLTLETLAGVAEMPLELLRLFIEQGLIKPVRPESESQVWFEASCVVRLRAIRRLRRDLGINLPGIAAVLDLLDRVQSLQREIESLRLSMNEFGERSVSERPSAC